MDYPPSFDPAEAIITEIIVISPSATVAEALQQLSGESTCHRESPARRGQKQHVSKLYAGCVLASLDGKTIDGILTERDFVRLAIQPVDLEHVTVGEVMTKAVISLRLDEFTDVFIANNIFQQCRLLAGCIHRLARHQVTAW